MLGNTVSVTEVATSDVPPPPIRAAEPPQTGRLDWRTVDRALRAIRQRRAALDAEEAHWLREAEALQVWRPLGMVSAIDYLERVLGYAPRTAQDRLRVARALGDLSQLTAALAANQLSYSAVRELTRVATPATETAWLGAATGKNLRQIEELVADRRPGDRPDDPPDPTARTRVVRFELSAETFALLRQARSVLDAEHPRNLTDDEFVAALCSRAMDDASATEPSGRAKFQIALTVCQRCRQGWHEAAGARIAVDAATVDRAFCDAQHIGSIDAAEPERAHQDIPPSVIRFVWRRDGGRCRVDGCRSTRGLEVHHLIHRADGGSHDPSNLILACSSCHQAHHAGTLTIIGTADHLEVRRPADAARENKPAASAMTDTGVLVAGDANPHVTWHATGRVQPVGSAGSVHVPASKLDSPGADDPVTEAKLAMLDSSAHVDDDANLHASATRSAQRVPPDGPTGNADATLNKLDASGADDPFTARLAMLDPNVHVGSDATGRIRAMRWAPRIPPVGVTGNLDAPINKLDAQGADDLVTTAKLAMLEPSVHVDGGASAHVNAEHPTPQVQPSGATGNLSAPTSRLDAAILRSQARSALTSLGWKPAIAGAAVAAAAAEVGPGATLEQWIFAALRQCPTTRR